MKTNKLPIAIMLVLVGLILALAAAPAVFAQTDAMKYKGWEPDSKYMKLYNIADLEDIKAFFVKEVEFTPLEGMHPGVGIVMYDRYDPDKEEIMVHLCPKGVTDLRKLKLRKGDRIKVRGVFAELGEDEIFMASKIKKHPVGEVKVRLTKNGKPIWHMTAEERHKEFHF